MKKQLYATVLTIFLWSTTAFSQVNTTPFTAALDTFNIISGTTLDAMMADDQYYSNVPIGFNFDFAGSTHTNMIVSCNGYIQLDTLPTNMFTNILCSGYNNRIAAFGGDLMHMNANASLQYTTIGTAPDRICVIQWLHYSYFGGGSGDVSFQIRLHETSNCISFVYGTNFYSTNPLQTQIGLRGDTSTDYLVLGDTSCNWAAAYPFNSIFTTFPVTSSCSMPAGFSYRFGACGSNGSTVFASVSGSVFNDSNSDGIRDTSESPISNHIISISPGNNHVASDAHGDYAFFFADSSLTYTIISGGITYWTNTTPSPASVSPLTNACTDVDFGYAMIPNIHEMEIHCPSWNAKPGQPEPMPIWYTNNGTSIDSDTITFVMDPLYSFISSNPVPTSVNGQIITWAYPAIAPGQSGVIHLQLLPDSSAVLGDTLHSTLSIGPLNDTVPTNNILALNQLLSNSWDPNEKLVYPSGRIASGDELTYTIHFQNTGNAPAANVVVVDTLDAKLDLMSFRVVGSSHSMNFTLQNSRTAVFTFYNIQLPDSGTDMAGSNGYVMFTIRSKSNLPQQSTINNIAGIYFDTNPAIITNTASVIIGLESPTGVIVPDVYTISATPNPNSGTVQFRFTSNESERALLSIYNATGQLVYQQDALQSNDVVNLSQLSVGVYTAVLKTENGAKTIKLLKQ